MYTYGFLVSHAHYLPSISFCYPLVLVSMPFFPMFFLFIPSFFLANIPFVITGDKSRVIGTRSSHDITPPPFPPPTYPVLQLALRSILLPHFAFKVRLSLPNNILSLDTSPCEGGRCQQRHNWRYFDPLDPRREVFRFFFSFPTYLLFRLYSQLNMIFSRDRRHRSPNKPN